jgi:membrane protease YdiL (CAAX protease family)
MIGLGLLLIASIGQCIVMHAATSVIIVHALFYLYAGLVEETLWRGTLWNIVSEKVGATWKVWGIVTAHFVVLHIPFALLDKPAPLFFIVQVVVLGSALGLLRILTKGVTGSVLLHAVVNMVVYT